MARQGMSLHYVIILVFSAMMALECSAFTEPSDVIALQSLYRALNKPPQLNGWRLEGGDPCLESWTGVSCYESSVIHLKLQGLNLSGYLGTELHYFHNLKHLDVSSNYIMGEIPYGLPPNSTHIDLACNNLSQNVPHSLPSIKFLRYLNLSHNSLSGPIGNIFTGLENLKEMDLSFNDFSGDLPSSFGSLTNLSGLFLQNNQFSGSVVYLAELPLNDLNIQSNHFSGVVPTQFQLIPNLWIDGNQFHTGDSYPAWTFPLNQVPNERNFPPTNEASAIEDSHSVKVARHKKKRLGPGGIACLAGGTTLILTCAAIYYATRNRRSHRLSVCRATDFSTVFPDHIASEVSPRLLPIKSPPMLGQRYVTHTRTEKTPARGSFAKNYKAPVTAKVYTVAELQSATNSFSEENLLGDGSLGTVYKAEFSNGQTFAVKNINTASLSFQEEEQFLEVIWTLSRLRHPNLVTLVGYCVEHGQHLLVYDYIRSLSLDVVLHTEGYKPLSWSTRLNIALGVARAIDYLHSTFSPPVVHGNLKAANILLDEELKPHLCDSGLAILRPLTSNSVKMKASEIAVGNSEYVAPDHGQPGGDNTKSDIYAFGVLLLELLTGRKPFDSSRPREEQSLVTWASFRLHDNAGLAQMVDPGIKRTLSPRSLSQFADIVSLCVQTERLFRPPMSEIVESLTRLLRKFTIANSSTTDDPFDTSFSSTRTRFMGSPTLSYSSF